ncbi:HPr kinase [Novosphingobium endophyticum]|uniref:HPr kinase n=1 Tax=Novosphingobium endophyticum TaxID=1955250 RepID=A0A916TPH9_9SPHN|nr:HPr kinase/phosphatase C-terminal domain-containing protein [Novosphingobium endophyticum]GGB87475.1 HPr kinase [Novosphingobium endophyticum]
MVQAKPSPLQASCVAIGGRGVLIEGATGSGKSSLALGLIDRGAHFLGDDGILVHAEKGRLVARPHQRIRGLLEVRNLGLLSFPCLDEAAISLVIRLDPNAPRYIEEAETVEIEGVAIPMLRVWPGGGLLAIKVELALDRFGAAV